MAIGIGIDTGGTYTDAAAYDFETKTVIAKGKALTTRENLTIGIGDALDCLPEVLLKKAKIVALSTTLATNACVEDKGGRARLVLLGISEKVLAWVGADKRYGLKPEETVCVEPGTGVEEFLTAQLEWLNGADALAVAEYDSPDKGTLGENSLKARLSALCAVPVVAAGELSNRPNVLERGATALLNARLLPVIREFIEAVEKTLIKRGVAAPVFIARSDGSLMTDALARKRPVETILSGPAASLLGGRGLASRDNCLIVDMGGTTTDVCVVKNGAPVMAKSGIRIGGWRTQVGGVFTDTFALGGDSAVRIINGRLALCARRVIPLCAAAARMPEAVKESLSRLIEDKKPYSREPHEFLFLVKEPSNPSRYDAEENALLEVLRKGPLPLGYAAEAGLNPYRLKSERLEAEGIVMRCGFTPTDAMHILGDFSRFDREASELAARYLASCIAENIEETDVPALAEAVYGLVRKKLYQNLVRVLLYDKFPPLAEKGLDGDAEFLIEKSWDERDNRGGNPFFGFGFATGAALVGIGAPTHVFLPEVAAVLGAECVIPENAEVANAVGAVLADISAMATVGITAATGLEGEPGYVVHTRDGQLRFETREEAFAAAEKAASEQACEEARRRGALGELTVKTRVNKNAVRVKGGHEIELRSEAQALASGRIEL